MAGKLKDVRIVTFKEAFGRYSAGDHAMHVSVAEKVKKQAGAKVTVKNASEEMEKLVEKVKAGKAKSEDKK